MTVPSPAPERLLNYDQGPQRLGMRARSFALDLGCDFADREITALQYRLTNINKALIQRGEAGCSQCLDTAKALDLHCSETTTWSNHSGMGEQQRQLLHQTLIQARHAFYGCSQHGNISNDNVSALPDTDHLLMLSMSAPSSSAVISQPPSQISKSRRENKEKDANCARTDLGSVEINPRKSDSRPAQRANIIDQMLNAVRDRSRNAVMYLANDLSWFDGLKTIAYAPVAAGRPCPEAAKDITVALVSAITQRPSKITNNERFLLFCVFKVLDSMKVPVNDIVQKFAPRHRPGPHRLKYQLQGVVWANELMEDLYSRGWGYRALDLLLFWNLQVCTYTLLKSSRQSLYDSLVETLARPEYRNKFSSGSVRVNESIPSIVQTTLQGTVSYRNIAEALGYTSRYVQETENTQAPIISTLPTSHETKSSSSSAIDGGLDYSELIRGTEQSTPHEYKWSSDLELDGWCAKHCTITNGSLGAM